jgi:hypothetical protein
MLAAHTWMYSMHTGIIIVAVLQTVHVSNAESVNGSRPSRSLRGHRLLCDSIDHSELAVFVGRTSMAHRHSCRATGIGGRCRVRIPDRTSHLPTPHSVAEAMHIDYWSLIISVVVLEVYEITRP